MKHVLLSLITAGCLFLLSCEKDSDGKDLITDTPKTETPSFLRGQWLNGNFAMSQWWTYDGQYVGNPYQSSRAFTFKPNGEAEFFQVIKTHTGACATEAFSYFKGTTAFDVQEKTLTFYPRQGNFRGFYSCSSGQNFNRDAARNELNTIKLYYEEVTDSEGQKWMVTSFTKNAPDTEKNHFRLTNW
ncbi:MAG: hypothetical protein KIT80_12895 [Chitinophagaceae bacterium]|nr:hypothetical protein [Chitinophagaceae bacterium]MCW5927803.1 hypothetical protein [Chitinophagaceae bacterium]